MNWKTLEKFKKLSDKIDITFIKGNLSNPIPGDLWEAKVTGEIKKDMSKKMTIEDLAKTVTDLSKTVTDLSKTVTDLAKTVQKGFEAINSRLDNIETRLENVEQRLDILESLPTIQKELKLNKNN